jgi:hypothetical protein
VDEVEKGYLGYGCSDKREMYGLPVGSSKEGDLHLVMDENVSKTNHAFYLLFFIDFLFIETNWGTMP